MSGDVKGSKEKPSPSRLQTRLVTGGCFDASAKAQAILAWEFGHSSRLSSLSAIAGERERECVCVGERRKADEDMKREDERRRETCGREAGDEGRQTDGRVNELLFPQSLRERERGTGPRSRERIA